MAGKLLELPRKVHAFTSICDIQQLFELANKRIRSHHHVSYYSSIVEISSKFTISSPTRFGTMAPVNLPLAPGSRKIDSPILLAHSVECIFFVLHNISKINWSIPNSVHLSMTLSCAGTLICAGSTRLNPDDGDRLSDQEECFLIVRRRWPQSSDERQCRSQSVA